MFLKLANRTPLLRVSRPQYFSYSTNLTSPLKVCIVGGGPGGFYTCKYLLKKYQNAPLHVTIVDQYPTPYGLVRYGVAPDHPEVKKVINDFRETVIQHSSQVHFVGNVKVGNAVQFNQLKELFDVVVLSYGASSERRLHVPGEDLFGVESAREFVSWYNGLPESENWNISKQTEKYETLLSSSKQAVVIGNGNVALDVTRILARPTIELHPFDMTHYSLQVLEKPNPLKKIFVVGRRGPVQASCTIKELKELSKIPNTQLYVDPQELHLDQTSQKEMEQSRAKHKIFNFLQDHSQSTPQDRCVQFSFCKKPVAILGDASNRVKAVQFEKTKLIPSPNGDIIAEGTGEMEQIECDLVLKSIGYKSVPIPGVPFDEKAGIIPNELGRVLVAPKAEEKLNGVYVAGWVSRGPNGVILSNIGDGQTVADFITEDVNQNVVRIDSDKLGYHGLVETLNKNNVHWVSFKEFEQIDQHEIQQGQKSGKLREKMTHIPHMIQIAKGIKS